MLSRIAISITGVNDCGNLKQRERMLEVMALVPSYGWGLLLAEVENRIGTDALQRIIERVYYETERWKIEDLKRALTAIRRK
jgi:hypothetical protein